KLVTGVQTCALPIFGRRAVVQDAAILRPHPSPLAIDRRSMQLLPLRAGAVRPLLRENTAIQPAPAGGRAIAGELGRPAQLPPLRSEERRVGTEGRAR